MVPRIRLTTYCNRSCVYCSAYDSGLKYGVQEFKPEEYRFLLERARKEGIKEVAWQGGEPTSHSQINLIAKLTGDSGTKVHLFTNGIFDPALLKPLKRIVSRCLVNLNHPDTYRPSQLKLVRSNLLRMKDEGFGFHIGYNLYQENPDYGFIFKAIEEYAVTAVRFDVARPSKKGKNLHFAFNDFFRLKAQALKFIALCRFLGARAYLDCCWPRCVFKEEEIKLLKKAQAELSFSCKTTVDILPGLRIDSCYCSIEIKDKFFSQFPSFNSVLKFLKNKEDRLRWDVPTDPRCINCSWRKNKVCQGSCLGYAK
ncbi:MAG: radical SAM protein [Candidatus Omnitrophica bacterium]|nr:radical SAM protein [Candidatus Omnitrophota bacterium]